MKKPRKNIIKEILFDIWDIVSGDSMRPLWLVVIAVIIIAALRLIITWYYKDVPFEETPEIFNYILNRYY